MTAMANSTVLQWAGATDVGRVRSNNQDRYFVQPGLWIVADGMGGHRGGEIASRLACEALTERYDQHTVDGLIDAIESANTAVHTAGNNDADLTGMGTTVVAIALVDDNDEEVLAIANVGDSRAYRLTAGELEQLTEDHSLVADMVREGSLSPDEAATHPQRNILTRVLGVYEEIPVDVLTVVPRHGDRYLLCSDGLFNEVSEDGIAAVLRRLADPGDAADELIRLAVEGGGRDNVTVVIVDVVSDGDQAQAASDALATDTPTTEGSVVPGGGAYVTGVGEDEDEIATGRFRRRHRRRDDAPDEDEAGPRHRRAERPRRLTWRVLLFSLIVLAVLGGALATVQWYGRSAYFVGFSGNDVAIFRGRPGGVLWIDPSLVDTTGLTRSEVPADTLDTLEAGKQVTSLEEATAYVDRLEDRVEEARDEAERDEQATTTTTTSTTTTAPPPPAP